MPKISIIIPCYKVEKYLRRCLDSVLVQTFKNWEAICVNDGSPDECGNILDEYARKDSRFNIIHQENKGASIARNNGLDAAKGDWICFVDSDDIIHPQMLEIVYNKAVSNNVDMVHYKYREFKTDDVDCIDIDLNAIKGKIFNNPALVTCRKSKYYNTFGPVAKFIKKEVIGKIRFIPHLQFEDYPFVYEILSQKPKALYLDTELYFYRIREVSLSHIKADPQQIKDYHTGINHIFKIYENPELKKEKQFLIRDFLPIILKHQLGRCRRADNATKPLMFAEFSNELRDLNNKGWLSWRGHKLCRYLTYKKLIKENRNA